MPTLNGHGLGKKPDRADDLDLRYSLARPKGPIPPSIDLRRTLPAAFDQLDTNSCGPNSGAALLDFFYPQAPHSFSRLWIYYKVRELEGDVSEDGGVETRDVLKVLTKFGAPPEELWPFDESKMFEKPPAELDAIALRYRLGSYSRLVSEGDYLACLASGFPFIMGFMVPETLDSDAVNRTGILPRPNVRETKIVGGHDVLCVGFDRNFRETPFFKSSGIDPALVEDTMLLIRNSWGPSWSPKFRGHFWLPLSYAVNRSTGGDAWTGRINSSLKVAAPEPPALIHEPTKVQLDAAEMAAFRACRLALDNKTPYGTWVSDESLRPVTNDVAVAVAKAVVRAG